MSSQDEDAEFDEADLKESLLKVLQENGTLKSIQGQLTAAIYAAFYEKKNNTAVPTPASVSSLLTSLNGITVISLVVDLLETLKLKHTLQVFLHEANLASVHLKSRGDLLVDLTSPSTFSDSLPLLMSLIQSNKSEKIKIVQPEGDKLARNNDTISDKKSESSPRTAPLDSRIDTVDARQNVVNIIPNSSPSTDLLSQPSYSKHSTTQESERDIQFPRSQNITEAAILRTASPVENSSDLSGKKNRSLTKEPDSDVMQKSDNNSLSSKIHATSVKQVLIQPKDNDFENKYSDESFSSGSDNSVKNSRIWLDEAVDDGAPSVGENDLSESINRLDLVSPDHSTKQDLTLNSNSDEKPDSLFFKKKSTSNSDHLFKATPGKSLNHPASDIKATVEGDSDIDSETNDFTVNSSRTEGCDYMEPVQSLI